MATLSRRGFLGASAGLAAGGAAAAGMATAGARSARADAAEMFADIAPAKGHIVHDPAKCAGCRVCEIVCSLSHWGVVNPDLSNIRIRTDILGGYISEAETCRQCPGPECVAACPTGAMHIDPETGARMVDQDQCIGCQSCLNACPAVPPRVHFNPATTTCIKCDLCGGEPRCVANCPAHALSASWVEEAADANVIETDAGITVTLSLTGAVTVVARESVEVCDIDARVTDEGVAVSGTVNSDYTQPFEAKIKVGYFDAAGETLYFSERQVVSLEVGGSGTFEDVFVTDNPQAVASCNLEVMCGKIAG